jgi:hypothetical protein
MPCRRLSITTLPLPLTLTRGCNRDCDRMIRRARRSRLEASFDRPTCALFPSALCEQLPQAFGRLEARRPHRQDACATNAVSPCTRDERLITVPAHYGFFPSPGHRCCFPRHHPVFYVLRKTSTRPDAGSAAGTTRSGKGLVECGRATL